MVASQTPDFLKILGGGIELMKSLQPQASKDHDDLKCFQQESDPDDTYGGNKK